MGMTPALVLDDGGASDQKIFVVWVVPSLIVPGFFSSCKGCFFRLTPSDTPSISEHTDQLQHMSMKLILSWIFVFAQEDVSNATSVQQTSNNLRNALQAMAPSDFLSDYRIGFGSPVALFIVRLASNNEPERWRRSFINAYEKQQ